MDDKILDRRMFLGLAGAGAGAVLAAPDVALAKRPFADDTDLQETLSVERVLLGGSVAPDVPTASGWNTDKLLNQAAATMLWSARVQKATPEERESVVFKNAVDARFDGMMSTLWAMGLELDQITDSALADTEAMILENPALLEEAQLKFTLNALDHKVSSEDVHRVDRAFKRTLWRIKHRGLGSVRDDLIGKLDKAAKRDGIDWRAEALRGADQPFVLESGRPDEDWPPGYIPSVDVEDIRYRARRQTTTGAVMLGIGIVWVSNPYFLIFGGICFGPPLIIAGIVKLVAAGKKRRKAERLEEMEIRRFEANRQGQPQ